MTQGFAARLFPEDGANLRRKKRNAKTYRSQKRRRIRRKAHLVEAAGGQCADCGYAGVTAAFEFHHREPASKEFALGDFSGALARLLSEAAKCDLLCANCHRIRHAALDAGPAHPVVLHRRRRKIRAVLHMGSTCHTCGRDGPPALFEFHHLDATQKDFGLSEDGIPRTWAKMMAELAKCVMLCANCHREVHAGVRPLVHGPLGVAEDAFSYAA